MASMDDDDRLLHHIRLLQRRTKCSNAVCDDFVRMFRKYCGTTGQTLKSFDRKARQAAGVNYIILHGCPKCDKHIYGSNDRNTNCPFKKEDGTVCGHPRFEKENEAWEV
jgi:hypothetical protein